MQVIDERELVVAHQAGEHEAFPAIVRAHGPGLYRHALSRLHDPGAAEDAVQETLLRAYRSLPRFNGQYHLRSWLHRILANVCSDEQQRLLRDAALRAGLASAPEVVVPAPDHTLEVEALRRELAAAIAELPDTYREAIELRELDGLHYREVAELTGVSEANARARVHRARSALRLVLTRTSLLLAALLGVARRLQRGLSNTASAAQASVADPVVTQLTASVGMSAPAKAALISTVIGTVATATAIAVVPGSTSSHSTHSVRPPVAVASAPAVTGAAVPKGSSATSSGPAVDEGTGAPTAAVGATTGGPAASAASSPGTKSTATAAGTSTSGGSAAAGTSPVPPQGSAAAGPAPAATPPPSSSSSGPGPSSTPPPAPPAAGEQFGSMSATGLSGPSSGSRVATSGPSQLQLKSSTLDGSIDLRATLPDAPADGQPAASSPIDVLFTHTRGDGTVTRVHVSGTLVYDHDADGQRVYRFDGTFDSSNGAEEGIADSGQASGQLAMADSDHGLTLTGTLTAG